MGKARRTPTQTAWLVLLPVVVFLVSVSIGRYPVSIDALAGAVWAQITGAEMSTAQLALVRVRLPRNVLAMIVGSALSLSARSIKGCSRTRWYRPIF